MVMGMKKHDFPETKICFVIFLQRIHMVKFKNKLTKHDLIAIINEQGRSSGRVSFEVRLFFK